MRFSLNQLVRNSLSPWMCGRKRESKRFYSKSSCNRHSSRIQVEKQIILSRTSSKGRGKKEMRIVKAEIIRIQLGHLMTTSWTISMTFTCFTWRNSRHSSFNLSSWHNCFRINLMQIRKRTLRKRLIWLSRRWSPRQSGFVVKTSKTNRLSNRY